MKRLFLVGLAGLCGALLRTSIGVWVGEASVFPMVTFMINLVAAWILCFLAAGALRNLIKSESLREIIMTGFLGSFSTFSAFSIETVTLIENGRMLIAVVYVLASLVGGLIAGYSGFVLGRKWQST